MPYLFFALLLALAILGVENVATAPSTHPQLPAPTAVFRFFVDVPNKNAWARRTCIATQLQGNWAITAAHCLGGNEEFLNLRCTKGSRTKKIALLEQARHPTHDVTVFSLDQQFPCYGRDVKLAKSLSQQASFFTPNVTTTTTKPSGLFLPLEEISRDTHTIRLRDAHACLTRGDSGSPLFQINEDFSLELGGLLISGSTGCPSRQTAVRLDALSYWILDNIKASSL